jgi:hypothetical protein
MFEKIVKKQQREIEDNMWQYNDGAVKKFERKRTIYSFMACLRNIMVSVIITINQHSVEVLN